MKIMVPVRRVPNPDVKVRLKKDGTGIETEGVNFLVNPFDEYAIEEAVRITEKGGGEVFLVSIGTAANEETLRAGLALGAQRAYLVEVEGSLDSAAVADILAGVYNQEKPDLVIAGKQSVDTDNNQAAQMFAAKTGLPQACFAYKVEVAGTKATVQREIDGGLETKEVDLPCLITADLRLNQPRYASLPAIMKAKKKEVKKVKAADVGVAEPKSCTRVLGLSEPPPRKAGQKVSSVDELVEKLKNEAKVI